MKFFEDLFKKPKFLRAQTYEFPILNLSISYPITLPPQNSQPSSFLGNFTLYSSSELKSRHRNDVITLLTQIRPSENHTEARIHYITNKRQVYAFDTILKRKEKLFLDLSTTSSPLNSSLVEPFMGFSRPVYTLQGLYSSQHISSKKSFFKADSSLEEKISFLEVFLDSGIVHSLKSFEFIQDPQLYLELLEQEYVLHAMHYAKKL